MSARTSQIRRLPEQLIGKIAAGEVIERPASVVKELVENAIDAGSKNIRIEIEEGGRQLIRVIDDGSGMIREELELSVERHTTSKIVSEEDLFRIRTLGFRGEALSSIAAVSKLTLESRREGSGEEGCRLEIEGGRLLKISPAARETGTTVSVRNLFFNTPARLKFLKSRETEFSHIAQSVEAIALAKSEVGFLLTHRAGEVSRRELQTPPRTSFRDRIVDLLGSEIGDSLIPISVSRNHLELTGFVSPHDVNSPSAKSLTFFVNGRVVRDRTLQHAVLSAYENLLMKHRYPWVFLNLHLSADRVDVNVHPTKSEVRFADSQLVHELVREGVRKGLSEGLLQGPAELAYAQTGPRPLPQPPSSPFPTEGRPTEVFSEGFEDLSEAEGRVSQKPGENTFVGPSRKIIGQVHGTYLLVETPEKLILIDQHAAHERIGFEKLKSQFETGGVVQQHLLVPQTFELKPSEAEILKHYLDDLHQFGLDLEPFGRSSFVIRSVPVLLVGEDVVGLIIDLIDAFHEEGKLSPLEEKVHQILETIACHRQIRAGDRLSEPEIEALLREMEQTNFSYSCPHGRPAILQIPFDEIEKWFKRRL